MNDAAELARVLEVLGWSGTFLAQQIDVNRWSVYNWLKGRARVPGPVKAYLNLVLKIRDVGFLVADGRNNGRKVAIRHARRPIPGEGMG